MDEVMRVQMIGQCAHGILERRDLRLQFCAQFVGVEAIGAGHDRLLRQKVAVLIHQRRAPLRRQQRPARREVQMHAQTQAGRF